MSKKSPDRRKYCGQSSGSNPTIALFGCYRQYQTSSEAVPVLRNVTAVTNYANPATPADIAPYGRPAGSSSPNCGQYYNYTCGNGTNGNLFCNPPSNTSSFAPASDE